MKNVIRTDQRAQFLSRLDFIFALNGMTDLLDDTVRERLFGLAVRLTDHNTRTNLTAITDIDGVILKHFVDSLTVLPLLKDLPYGATLADVGCGAGFPSLPIAILRPDLNVTGIDSTAKKLDFIRETATVLGLDNVSTVNARAEELAKTGARETFDAIVARGVARLNILSELCLPLVRIGGRFLPMKATLADEELTEAHTAIKVLGGKYVSSHPLTITDGTTTDSRVNILIEKSSATPKEYPRQFGVMKKRGIGGNK